MSKKMICFVSFVFMLSLASTTYGIVIGNFENVMDSWVKGSGMTTSYSTTGVTLGTKSLKLSGVPNGSWWTEILQTDLNARGLTDDLLNNDIFSMDVTRLTTEWTANPDPCQPKFSDFILIVDAQGCLYYNVGTAGQWNGTNNPQTVTWDYSAAKNLMPSNPTWCWLHIIARRINYTAGGIYYFDKFQLLNSGRAWKPNPADDATDVQSNAILSWTPGVYAKQHDVYLGTDFNDVNEANSSDITGIYRGRKDVNTYDPPLLNIAETYYWRIDEVNDTGPAPYLWRGNIWSFTVVSYKAWGPSPADGTIYVPLETQPGWHAGVAANRHRMYFGTDYNDVNNVPVGNTSSPLYKGYSTDTTWGNEGTEQDLNVTYNTTYYWRIDEVNTVTVTTWKGDVWEFTSVPPGGKIVIGDWEDNMDGWALGDGVVSASYSTTGATLNNKSLKLEIDPNWQIAMSVGSPDYFDEVDFKSNDTFKIDVTWVTNEWTGGSWAKIENLVINAAGIGWTELGPPDTDTSNPANPGNWDPYSYGEIDTRTLTWNYSDVNLVEIPNGGYIELIICTNHDPFFGTGTYYFDNARLLDSKLATNPDPRDRQTNVETDPTLSWTPGIYADKHDVYFGTDEDAVTDANRTSQLNVLIKQNYDTNSIDIANDVGPLEFDTTYYWRIDEVNGTSIWTGTVWRFTTGHHFVVDDFESYNPSLANTWKAGGKATVNLSTDPVHDGDQAMAIDYNNNTPAPYYSEAYANSSGPNSLDFGTNWRLQDVKALSLWFRGQPDVRGKFTINTGPPVTYTIEGAGWDIEETADGFHYAYKMLTKSTWQITARVVSVENTDPWAKAGVMVRKTSDPNSIYAAVMMTPSNGVSFQYRDGTLGGDTTVVVSTGFTPPHWVRLTRVIIEGYDFVSAEHANDVGGAPDDWTQIDQDIVNFTLGGSASVPIYMGLCVTSHNPSTMCTAQLSNVTMLQNFPPGTAVPGTWADKDIGVPYNDPEPMYVVLEDSNSDGIVYHPDPNVTQTAAWTEWRIDLNDYIVQGVDACDVQRMYIGFGDRDLPTQGGSGEVFFDDIRLYKAEFYPPECPQRPGDIVYDGMVDYFDLGVMAEEWLSIGNEADLIDDDIVNFKDFAELAKDWGEQQVWPTW
jgi:hypothetical protein